MSSVLSPDGTEAGKRALSVTVVGGTGLALAGFEIWHTFRMETLLGKVLMAILPLGTALVIVYASYWLSQSEFGGRAMLRITAWFVAGVVAMAAVAGWIVAHEFVRGAGFHHWHLMTVGAMTFGGVVGLLLGIFDGQNRRQRDRVIEERRRVEAEQEKLSLSNRILRHNILNSVTVIHGRAELLKERLPDEDQQDLDVIVSRSTAVVDLIEKVHTFIERVSTDGDPDVESITLSSLLETEIEKARRAFPEARISGDLPTNVHVLADEILAEVFENLLMNAVEHNDNEEPVVTVSIDDRGDTAVVSVADNGPGISDDRKEQIFSWDSGGASRPAMGVGLGLVETLVDQYGGSIWVEDNEPEGSIFRVMLRHPDHEPATAGAPDGQPDSAARSTSAARE